MYLTAKFKFIRHPFAVAANWTSSEFIPASSLDKYLYTLTELTPNSPYELRVLAQNRYGSVFSKPTVLKTSKLGE